MVSVKAIRAIAITFRIISTVIFVLAPQQGLSQISEREDSTTQEDNSKANLLFKQAITLHAGALSADGHKQNELYREVLSILDVIAESYPNSIPGRRIMLGKPLGPINIKALRTRVEQFATLEPLLMEESEKSPPEETAVAEGEEIHEPEATLQPTAEWYERIVTGGRIGSGYGHGEFPSWGQRTHAGVDIGGGCKLDVHAAAQGTVTHIINASDRDFDSVGNAVIIEHGSIGGRSTYTVYFHMAEAPLVQLGPVAKGAKLGVTGDTGAADGCHLHFEVRHFEGLYNPGWSNIYGLGNWADDPYFKTNWSDPEGWFKAQADPMLKRFETECQDADITDAPLACPFEEENTCIGEGCFKAGLAVTNGNIVFVESPGSDLEVFRTQQNEFLIYEESRVFSVPCRVRVLQSAVADRTGIDRPRAQNGRATDQVCKIPGSQKFGQL